MAAPTYATDLATINDCASNSTPDTFVEPTGETAGTTITTQTDFFIEGSACVSKITNTTGTSGVGFLDASGATTLPAGEAFFFWHYMIGPKALDTLANGGLHVLVGNTLANYYSFYWGGSNTYALGGWKRIPVDPTISAARNRTQGTPDGTWAFFGVGDVQLAAVAGAGQGIDYVAYGREFQITDGDGTTPATFSGAATTDATNAWGLCQLINGAYYLQGLFLIGSSGTAADFRDVAGAAVFFQDTTKVNSAFNAIEVRNALSRLDWTAVAFTALGTTSRGNFIVTDNADVNIDSCTFTNMGTFTLLAATAITNSTLRSCDTITAPGANLSGTSVLTSRVAADAGAVVWNVATNPDGLLDNMTFSKGTNAHHAIDFGTSVTGNITLRGCEFTGFGSTGDSNDSTVRFLATSGSLTLSLVSCTVNGAAATTSNFSIDDAAGIAVTLSINPVTALINVKNTSETNIQNARVFVKASDNTGPFPFEESVTIANSGTTATVTHAGHGMTINDKVIISGATSPTFDANNGIFTITSATAGTYTYEMGSSPGTPATGTIISTFVAISGLTDASGNISMSRVFSANQPIVGWVRKHSTPPSYTPPNYKTGSISGSINSTTGFTANVQLVSDD